LLFSPCFLKLLEKMLYRRMQWVIETRFLLPDFQSGFRNFRSCTDNLVMLTNRINSAFLNKAPTFAVFLDIAGAFDNVIPQILIQDLRGAGFPVCFYKFIQNLLFERSIFAVRNGDLLGPLIIHKDTPQGSIFSPLLFNFYLRNIENCLHKDTQILQYVNDIVLFSSNKSLSLAYNSLSTSLDAIYKSLRSLGLDLAPNKSQAILFSRDKKSPDNFEPLLVRGTLIPVVNYVRFLGVTLDRKLNGVSLRSLLDCRMREK